METTSPKNEYAEVESQKAHHQNVRGNFSSVAVRTRKVTLETKRANSKTQYLCIGNITQSVKAVDLQQILSPYGKVIGVRIVTSRNSPGACRYGFVKMNTVEDATNCIVKLDSVRIDGHLLFIKMVRPGHVDTLMLKLKWNSSDSEKCNPKFRHHRNVNKQEVTNKKVDKRGTQKEDDHKSEATSSKEKGSKRKSQSPHCKKDQSDHRLDSKSSRFKKTLDKVKEQERQRLGEHEHILNEQNRCCREKAAKQSRIGQILRSDFVHLLHERTQLHFERQQLETERTKIIGWYKTHRTELQQIKMRFKKEWSFFKRPASYRYERSYEDSSQMRFCSFGWNPRCNTPSSPRNLQENANMSMNMNYSSFSTYQQLRKRKI